MPKPTSVIFGSISDVTKKDALAIARGVAERQLESILASSIKVSKIKGRMVYEIHEGGDRISYMKEVVDAVEAGEAIRIQLANGRVAEMLEEDDEIITIIYSKSQIENEPAEVPFVTPLEKGPRLNPFHGDAREIFLIGRAISALGIFAFMAAIIAAGATNALSPQLPTPFIGHQLPSEALANINLSDDQYVRTLRFRDGEYNINVETVEPIDPSAQSQAIEGLDEPLVPVESEFEGGEG